LAERDFVMPLLFQATWLVRRRALILILLVASASISCFGAPVLQTVRKTPYDHQMVRVSVALTVRCADRTGSLSPALVNQWMTELRAIPYHYSRSWQTPDEVDFAQVGDCKGKALTLYARMRNAGATNLRLVIGKRHVYDSATHAWLEWETSAGSYLLDPTFDEAPVKLSELDSMIYRPLYAYDGLRKYRVFNVGSLPPSLRVASGISNQVGFPAISAASSAKAGLTPISRPMTYVPVQRQRYQSIRSRECFARPLGRSASYDSPARRPAFAAGPPPGGFPPRTEGANPSQIRYEPLQIARRRNL
jgi:hypothetical protein